MNILETIVAAKRVEVARLPGGRVRAETLQDAIKEHGPRRDFLGALRRAIAPRVALIAEVKKASPSAGIICPDFDPVRIARDYEAGGASCLSVLTDGKFFQGSLADLKRVRTAVGLPLLRKDFIIDERQILESIQWGADAILLITAILDQGQLRDYLALATEAGLAVLVEVHDEAELDRALAAKAKLIGVNNRDLKTFKVDLATTERLAARWKRSGEGPEQLLVAESGIHSSSDIQRLQAAGACAMLIGESLIRAGDIRLKIKALLRG